MILVVVMVASSGYWWWTRPSVEELLEGATRAMARGAFEEAGRLAEAAGGRASRPARAWLIAGEAAQRREDFEAAVRFYDRIPGDSLPADVAAGHASAATVLLQRLHRADEAEARYREGLAADPDHIATNKGLAVLLGISGRRREAVPLILSQCRQGHFGVDQLNMIDVENGMRYETSLLEACHRRDSADPVALLGLAVEMLRTHDYEQAITLARQSIRARKSLVAAHVVLGRALLRAGDGENIPVWQTELPETAGEEPEVWVIRGDYLRRQDQLSAAARCYWEALKRHPDHRAANYQLAELLRDLDREAEAEPFRRRSRQLQELKEIDDLLVSAEKRNPIGLLETKVRHLLEMGRAWEAWAWVQMSARLDPTAGWVSELNRVVRPLVNQEPPPPLTLAASNPARQLQLQDLPTGDWPRPSATGSPVGPVAVQGRATFRDDATTVGIAMNYFNSADGESPGQQMFEFTGGGVAVLDFDRDGWPDLYFTQGARWPVSQQSSEHLDRLYRNRGDGHFHDVTAEAGLVENGFSQGATVGDLDGDGFPDLFVGNIGGNRVYHNNGDGTFEDVTVEAGVAGDAWTTSSVLADIDGDGQADLYVVNYLSGDDVFTRMCRHADGLPRMCQPFQFSAAQDRLYLGRGDGRFRDVTDSAGLGVSGGKGLGVVVADLEGRGRLSLFVANDTRPNFLFAWPTTDPKNVSLLRERGVVAGVGFNSDGRAEGCMGVAAGDADGDGRLDLFVTNFLDETNTLFSGIGVERGSGLFRDRTREAGLAESSRLTLGFGTQFLDGDLDGHLDLVVTNGHVDDYSKRGRPYRMEAQYYQNRGDGRFDLLSAGSLGPHFSRRYLGRGLARVDWNRDGLPDVAISTLDIPAVLLTNTTAKHGHFLRLQLVGTRSHRDAIGARVTVECEKVTRVHQLTAGDGYHASNERTLLIGLGAVEQVRRLVVDWPSGFKQEFTGVTADRNLVAIEGRAGLVELP